jgi:hypothetical protein
LRPGIWLLLGLTVSRCDSAAQITEPVVRASLVTATDKVTRFERLHRDGFVLEAEWQVQTSLLPQQYLSDVAERLSNQRYRLLGRADLRVDAGRSDEADMFRVKVAILGVAPTRATVTFRITPY